MFVDYLIRGATRGNSYRDRTDWHAIAKESDIIWLSDKLNEASFLRESGGRKTVKG